MYYYEISMKLLYFIRNILTKTLKEIQRIKKNIERYTIKLYIYYYYLILNNNIIIYYY